MPPTTFMRLFLTTSTDVLVPLLVVVVVVERLMYFLAADPADNKTQGCRSDHYFSQDLNQGGENDPRSCASCRRSSRITSYSKNGIVCKLLDPRSTRERPRRTTTTETTKYQTNFETSLSFLHGSMLLQISFSFSTRFKGKTHFRHSKLLFLTDGMDEISRL